MGKTRSELRDIACNVIYQTYIFDKAGIKYDINELIKEKLEVQNDFVLELVSGVLKNQKEISSLANKYLVDWDIDRLSKVDKAILSLAIYELMHTETP